ncbi:MAG TPA: YqgE/AlgH family protein [Solirubrobacteraceae bacterium]|nr:YqgE/AlgH family protein [Solirubrobacteraceae bacterium]
MDSARGQLLVAGPGLLDPNFWRTVVLIVEHSDEGALGLVLNRPSETTVGEAVSELEELLDLAEPLYVGGPVQPSALIVLAEFDRPAEAALIAFEDIGVLANGAQQDPSLSVRRGRAFVGHSGWGPGQLDDEVERGDWIIEPALRDDAFTGTPLDLWSSVLTRKGGSYALVARMPPDPSVN